MRDTPDHKGTNHALGQGPRKRGVMVSLKGAEGCPAGTIFGPGGTGQRSRDEAAKGGGCGRGGERRGKIDGRVSVKEAENGRC